MRGRTRCAPPRGSDPVEIPAEVMKDTLPTGDFHEQEERRLFYVGMTRAKERLYLTSAEDLGGKRKWKVSQFILEALDLPKDAARPFRAQAIEQLRRLAPPPEGIGLPLAPIAHDEPLAISHRHVAHSETCPHNTPYTHPLPI